MLTPQEIIESLDMTANQRVNSARVEAPVFQELVGILALLQEDKVSEDDYKTNLDIPNLPLPTGGGKSGKKDKDEFQKNFDFAFQVLEAILEPYKEQNKAVAKNVSKATPIPQEIRTVVCYMAYRAMELADRKYGDIEKADKEVSQSEILKRLGLGHNSFTNWGMRPKQYYYVTHYEQPNSPIHYMGAKTGDYGYAVRNLVYQSGQNKAFADIFGGGGNATLAVPPIDTMKCHYNEVDPIVFNAVEVLKDEKLCQKLIGLYQEFCDELQGRGRSELLAGYLTPNAARQAINNAHSLKTGKTKGQVGKIKDVNPVSVRLTYDEMRDFLAGYEKGINRCMACGQTEIQAGGEAYSLSELKDKDYHDNIWWKFRDPAVQEVAEVLGVTPRGHHVALTDDSIGDGFEDDIPFDVTRDDDALFKKYMGGAPLTPGEQARLGELEVSAVGQRFDFVHYMMLCYWYLFNGMVKGYRANGCPFAKEEDKVFYAFAYIFLRYFAFHRNKVSDNDIRNADNPTALSNGSTVYKNNEKIEKFLNCSLLPEIEAFRKRFRKLELSNGDFRVFIDSIINNKNYSDKGSVVFYSDSPYLETTGYGAKEDKKNAFSDKDMEDLIVRLINSGQKFIFSCRACKSLDNTNKLKRILRNTERSEIDNLNVDGLPKLKASNKVLHDAVFKKFESEAENAGVSLNVLAIEEGDDDLAGHIRESNVIEIMICNFDIHDFSNTGKSAKTMFTAYTYQNFLNIFNT